MTRMDTDRIHQGDCLQLLAELPPACIDLAFADPPFNIGYEYDRYDDRRAREDYLTWAEKWLAAVRRVLKPTGSFFVAIDDEYAAEINSRNCLLHGAPSFDCLGQITSNRSGSSHRRAWAG